MPPPRSSPDESWKPSNFFSHSAKWDGRGGSREPANWWYRVHRTSSLIGSGVTGWSCWLCSMDVGNGPGACELREQRDPVRDAVFQNAFVRGVGTLAYSSQAIQRGNAQSGGEVAVRASSGGGFFEIHAQILRQLAGEAKELDHALAALERRTVQSSVYLQCATLVERLQRMELAVERRKVARTRECGYRCGPRRVRQSHWSACRPQ